MAVAESGSSFRVKWQIPDVSSPAVATVLQQTQGPCPLLALANALLLRRIITMPANTTTISEEQLLGCVCQAECAMKYVDILPKLGKEVAVDLCFSGTTDFVTSPELSVFEGMDIRLVHGAIPDPHDDLIVECVSPLSYNEVCDRLVAAAAQCDSLNQPLQETTTKSGTTAGLAQSEPSGGVPPSTGASTQPNVETSKALDDELSSGTWSGPPHLQLELSNPPNGAGSHAESDTDSEESLVAQNAPFVQAFLDDTASMMTFHGLSLLHQTLVEDEVAVLFYNNHFSVLKMNKSRLFTLVTDEGYIRAPNVVYEGLSDVDGNTNFFDARFEPVNLNTTATLGSAVMEKPAAPSRQEEGTMVPQASAASTRSRGTSPGSPTSRMSKKLGKKTCSLQ